MNEEKEDKNPSGKLQDRRRKNLTIYALLLLAFVVTLILGSYINQQRVDKEMQLTISKLNEKTAYAEGVEHNIGLLQEENIQLKETVTDLKDKISSLESNAELAKTEKELLQDMLTAKDAEKTAALTEEQQKSAAYEAFASFALLYSKKDYAGCRAKAAEMENANMLVQLSEGMRKEYDTIRRKIK